MLAVVRDLGGDTLGDGVKGRELLRRPAVLENLAGLGVVAQGRDGDAVNRVERLDVVRRRERGDGHHPLRRQRAQRHSTHVDVDTLGDEGVVNRELVGGERAGLVRAEHVAAGEGLDGGELLADGLAAGEVGGADGERGRGDAGQTDGHTNDAARVSHAGGCSTHRKMRV